MRAIIVVFWLVAALSASSLAANETTINVPSSWRSTYAVGPNNSFRELAPGAPAVIKEGESLQVETGELGASAMKRLTQIDALVPITKLELNYNFLTDEGFAHVCKLQQLTSLEISCRDKLTDEGFARISALKQLKELELHRCNFGDAGLAHLKELEKLDSLTLWGMGKVSSAGFATVGTLQSLKHLRLYFNDALDAKAMAEIAKAAGLKSLDLHQNQEVTPEYLAPFAERAILETLDLDADSEAPDRLLAAVAAIKSLKSVRIERGGKITDTGIVALAELPLLESLAAPSHPLVTGAGFKAFAKSPKLTTLNLSECGVTDSGALEISTINTLEWLSCRSSPVLGDAGVESIGQLTGLTFLDLSSCEGISPAGFLKLGRLVGLRTVCLGATWFGDESAALFDTLCAVEELWLNGTALTSKGAAHLVSLSRLKNLYLRYCEKFGDVGLVQIGKLASLEDLDLGYTGITGRGLRHLKELKKLRRLDLECTNVSDDGLGYLTETGIETLDITHCSKLTDECVPHLKAMQPLKRVLMRPCPGVNAHVVEAELAEVGKEAWTSVDEVINAPLSTPAPPELPEPADKSEQ